MTLFVVWSPATIITALVAGLGVGYWIVGRIAADPAWASPAATPIGLGTLTGGLAILVGIVFYAGQATATLVEGDQNWDRVISRFSLWILYSLAMGVGTWLRLRRHIERKQSEAHERAVSELEAGS